jgi:hypothetical protein
LTVRVAGVKAKLLIVTLLVVVVGVVVLVAAGWEVGVEIGVVVLAPQAVRVNARTIKRLKPKIFFIVLELILR